MPIRPRFATNVIESIPTPILENASMTNRTRKIEVDALSRVEGEGALRVTVQGDVVTDVRLEIYEPPRFFEALLRGRSWEDSMPMATPS